MNEDSSAKPIGVLRQEFEECKQELRQAIEAWYGMPERFWWQRRRKEEQRQYCCQLLERLRRLAPDSQEVRDREAELSRCAPSPVGGQR